MVYNNRRSYVAKKTTSKIAVVVVNVNLCWLAQHLDKDRLRVPYMLSRVTTPILRFA